MKTSGTPLNDFADQIVSILKSDPRFVGTSRGRLVSKGDIDDYSDLDLDLVVEEDDYSRVMATSIPKCFGAWSNKGEPESASR